MDEVRYKLLGLLFAVGAIIGFGKHLSSDESFTPRNIVGRMISTGGLAVSAATVIQVFPGVPPLAVVGVAAMLASLGTSFLSGIISKFLNLGGQ